MGGALLNMAFHIILEKCKGDSFESRLANIYFGKASKSQNVKMQLD